MALSLVFVLLSVTLPFAVAAPSAEASACTGTISSLDDVAAAVKCTTVNINAFTVPAGKTFELDLADGTTVNMREPRDPRMRSLHVADGLSVIYRGHRHIR